jgi:4-amino-4-deoxy-L-arabinose transferase-like glycosyltransferase
MPKTLKKQKNKTSFFENLFRKKNIYWMIGVISLAAYLVTRLTNIQAFPIFTDEAIYVRWAQIAGNDPDWFFISLTDGKQPLFIWFAIAFMKFISDPLLAARMVSVLAGLFSMIGLFFLTNELFKNKRMGFVASFLYLVYPFALVYDRLALYDSLVATFIIWALYLEILLVRRLKLSIAITLGIVIGLGLLNKTSANFALILLPFSLLLFDFRDELWKKKLVRWVMYAAITAILAQAMYMLLRISPFFYIIAQKDAVFVYPLNEWIQHPFTFLYPNLTQLGGWLVDYSTVPFLLFVFAALFFNKKDVYSKLLLLAWFIIPFVALAMFGKQLYPRYILFMTMPLLVLGAYSFYTILHGLSMRWIKTGIFAIFMLPFVITDVLIITNFAKAPIAQSDKNQYFLQWPAGAGVKETIEILKKESKNKKIFVGTQGTFGLMPYALEIYLHDNPNITIFGIWPIDSTPPKELLDASKKMPTYVFFYQPCGGCPNEGEAPATWNLKKIYQFERPETRSYATLYKLQP